MAKNSNIDNASIRTFAVEIVRKPSHILDDISRAVISSYNRDEAAKLLDTILNFTTNDCPEDVKPELAGQVAEVIDLTNFQD